MIIGLYSRSHQELTLADLIYTAIKAYITLKWLGFAHHVYISLKTT
jgi:hypothetical protein